MTATTTPRSPLLISDAELRERLANSTALNDSELLAVVDHLVTFAADWDAESGQGQADARAMQEALHAFGLLPLPPKR